MDFCKDCQFGKQVKKSYASNISCKANVLDLVHSDVCSMPMKSMGGAMYFVTFIDDYSRKIWVYLLKWKSDVLDAFKKFHAFVTTQMDRKLKSLRANNGGEYTSSDFKSFCAMHGIRRELTTPYSPASNGVAEHYNRT